MFFFIYYFFFSGKTKFAMVNPEFNDVDILIATPGVLSKLSTVGIYKLNEVNDQYICLIIYTLKMNFRFRV